MKEKIEGIVEDYKTKHPDEYGAICEIVKDEHSKLKNNLGDGGQIGAMFMVPETLQNMIDKELDVEETTLFKTKSYSKWFANSFPEFKLTDEL